MASLLLQEQIQRPASTNMRARAAKMPKNVCVLAPGLFQGIGKHSEACRVKLAGRQGTFFVGDSGQVGHGRSEPGGGERGRSIRVAEDVTDPENRQFWVIERDCVECVRSL